MRRDKSIWPVAAAGLGLCAICSAAVAGPRPDSLGSASPVSVLSIDLADCAPGPPTAAGQSAGGFARCCAEEPPVDSLGRVLPDTDAVWIRMTGDRPDLVVRSTLKHARVVLNLWSDSDSLVWQRAVNTDDRGHARLRKVDLRRESRRRLVPGYYSLVAWSQVECIRLNLKLTD